MFKPVFPGASIALLLALLFTASCSSDTTTTVNTTAQASGGERIAVLFDTSMGQFTVELNADKAPVTVANFLQYVDEGFYNGTIFHRVINNFMVQGGGFTQDMQRKPTKPAIANEANNGLLNVTGSIAMARTSMPNSATSQFFINVTDNTFLNHRNPSPAGWGYAVFGQVSEGMEVINTIKAVETGISNGHKDVPVQPVIINSVSRVER